MDTIIINDDDFREEVYQPSYILTSPMDIFPKCCDCLIDIYEKRNLNVAANLILLIKQCAGMYKNRISEMILSLQESQKFRKYENDINKYLLLF